MLSPTHHDPVSGKDITSHRTWLQFLNSKSTSVLAKGHWISPQTFRCKYDTLFLLLLWSLLLLLFSVCVCICTNMHLRSTWKSEENGQQVVCHFILFISGSFRQTADSRPAGLQASGQFSCLHLLQLCTTTSNFSCGFWTSNSVCRA